MASENLNMKASTIMAMSSLTMSAFVAFAPSVFELKNADPKSDTDTKDGLALGELLAGVFIIGTAAFATYASGNWEIIAVAIMSTGGFYIAYNYLFEKVV